MTTWTDIDNGEGGQSVRNKLNSAMSYLFGWISDPGGDDQSRWEEDGESAITPKDEKSANLPALNVAGESVTNSLNAGGNVRVESDGKLFIDDLGESGISLPLLVDSDGRVRTAFTVDKYDVTFSLSVSGGQPIGGFTGSVWVSGNTGVWAKHFSETGSVVVEDIEAGEYTYTFILEGYQALSEDITITENKTVEVEVKKLPGIDPDTPPESRDSSYVKEGTAGDFSREMPSIIAERDVNYTQTLPDASENKTVELSARKAKTGGALTIAGGVVMDGEEKDVLTTTEKGAWVKLKSVEVDGDWKWVVIQDSGDWTLDDVAP